MNKIATNHQTLFNERKETVLVWDFCFKRKPIKPWFNFNEAIHTMYNRA